MSIMPWKPPLNIPSIPAEPAGVGLVSWLRHALKIFRLSLYGWILTFVGFALVPIIIKVMGGIGIGFISYKLGGFALKEVFSAIQSNINSLPPEILPFIAMSKIGEGMSIIFGGIAARVALMGFNSMNAGGERRGMIWKA